jgi:dihydrofolate reductase
MNNIQAIIAVDQDYGIAKNGQIPWKSKTDMRFFKEKTIHNIVVMGSKTLESLPRGQPLKDRLNIILTHHPNKYVNIDEQLRNNIMFFDEKKIVCFLKQPNIFINENQYKYLNSDSIIYIIGGKQIYDLFYQYCSTLWLTKIKAKYDCDLIFSKNIVDYFNNRSVDYEDDELEIIKLTNNI